MGKGEDLNDFDKRHIVISLTDLLGAFPICRGLLPTKKWYKKTQPVYWRQGHGRPRLISVRGE